MAADQACIRGSALPGQMVPVHRPDDFWFVVGVLNQHTAGEC
jgi:hypothetical protein